MKPDFTSLYDRWSSGKPRKEDMVRNRIHNDKTLGSKNIFTDKQITLLGNIIAKADEFFETCAPESEKYDITSIYARTPIFLIPYEAYALRMKNLCNSDFAKKMREKYEKEMKSIPQQCSQKEREKREKKIRKKYGPWIDGCGCDACARVWTTPLGYYVPEEDKIYICLDRIIDSYTKEKVDAVVVKVVLHELAHALMRNESHLHYESSFEYWAEESLANKIALKYINVASYILRQPALFINAKEMVQHQPEAYKLGLYLFERNACDWYVLKVNKPNINEVIGDKWVDVVCEDEMSYVNIQIYFYLACDKILSSLPCPTLLSSYAIDTMIPPEKARLKVEIPGEKIIYEKFSSGTLKMTIDEIVSKEGMDKVLASAISIKGGAKYPIVTDDSSVFTNYRSFKICLCGLYVCTDSNTSRKQELLNKLLSHLGLDWKISIE